MTAQETVQKSLQEKPQNLPLLCVESIFKFTPTSKLIRLYSTAVPLPGAFWNFGLEAVLKKRLPLSLNDQSPYQQAFGPHAIFDASGAEIARVKQPRAFRFSPLCELVECAAFDVRAVLADNEYWISDYWSSKRLEFHLAPGEVLPKCLAFVTDLTLVVRNTETVNRTERDAYGTLLKVGNPLLPHIKHLIPRLSSLTIQIANTRSNHVLLEKPYFSDEAYLVRDFLSQIPVHEMLRLGRLRLPKLAFKGLKAASWADTELDLAGLSTLAITELRSVSGSGITMHELQHISAYCTHLSVLHLPVIGEFQAYLAAFRALTGLATLGLYLLCGVDLKGLTFNESEKINSVTDLRLICMPCFPRSRVYAIASLFPNANSVGFQWNEYHRDAFDLASEFCAKQVIAAVRQLSCFVLGELSSCTGERLTEFLDNPTVPEVVDLSPVIFERLGNSAPLLTAIYRAMQSNSTRRLLLRGPVHSSALSSLLSHLDLNGKNAKVRSWKDRDLPRQPGIERNGAFVVSDSEFYSTDFEIIGTKASGIRKGELFSIRIFHQLAKKADILA